MPLVASSDLDIQVIELENDMIEIAMNNWSTWNSDTPNSKSHAKVSVRTDVALAK